MNDNYDVYSISTLNSSPESSMGLTSVSVSTEIIGNVPRLMVYAREKVIAE